MGRLRLPQKLWPPVFEAYPFPLALGVWAVITGLLVITGVVEPASWGDLDWLSRDASGVLTLVTGVAVMLGLAAHNRDLRPLAYGLVALALGLTVYGLAAVHTIGWHHAGVTAALRFLLAAASLGNALQLLAREFMAERTDARRREGGGR